ncbi:MAG: hypothetical protein RML33_11190 [Acidobacteriota bacterium]|nr:hypothetical protein [Leptospiraceae bacterium]MDW8305385.1 hypothetical protein [Acidobacteriota bacterium]
MSDVDKTIKEDRKTRKHPKIVCVRVMEKQNTIDDKAEKGLEFLLVLIAIPFAYWLGIKSKNIT